MTRYRGAVAIVIVAGFVLTTTDKAQGQKAPLEAITFNVTSKEMAEDFAKRPAVALKKFSPITPKTGKAKGKTIQNKLNIDGLVTQVDEKNNTVTLEGFKKVVVVIKATTISGEKAGKRVAVAKDGLFVEFKDKTQVILEFKEVKLEKYVEPPTENK